MTIRVRPFEEGEWRLFRELRLRAVADSPDSFRETLGETRDTTDEQWADLVSATVAHPRGLLLVAEQGEAGVGMAFARVDEDRLLHIGAMWVAPEMRGRGAGRLLLDATITWGSAGGAGQAGLWVTEGNTAAAALYTSAGFEYTGDSMPLREGSDLTVAYLTRFLS
jgi:GNAT superfamily N-acetyltransferase